MRILAITLCAFSLAWPPQAGAQKIANPCLDGETALAAGEVESAIDQLEQCLNETEQDAENEVRTYSALGAAYLEQQQFSNALSAYNMAFAIADTEHAEIANPTLWRNRGIARAQLEQFDTALEDLLHASRDMPDDVLTWLNLGFVYQQTDRPADAVASYDAVVRLEPEWMGGWLNRSSAFLDAGMTSAAVEDARHAVELEPENGSSLNMLCWTLI